MLSAVAKAIAILILKRIKEHLENLMNREQADRDLWEQYGEFDFEKTFDSFDLLYLAFSTRERHCEEAYSHCQSDV